MISGRFKLRGYGNWCVTYHLLTEVEDTEDILNSLRRTCCSLKFLRKAGRLLSSGSKDIGLTYSNRSKRRSVLVVSSATSSGELLNTFAHEIDHLEKHITRAFGLDPYGESASYLVGEIVRNIYNNIFKYDKNA